MAAAGALPVQADTIDFEGFADLTALGPVATATNTVTFGVGIAAVTGPGFVAAVGPPQTAFVPLDTPAALSAGTRFLTDEINGPAAALNYFMAFANPVANLSLDLYDFRADGGPSAGDTATLSVYADLARTMLVGTAVFTIPAMNPVDGNVVNLSVSSPSGSILAASVTFSTGDVGTGIDNVTFDSIPEPGVLGFLGVAAVLLLRRRRRPI